MRSRGAADGFGGISVDGFIGGSVELDFDENVDRNSPRPKPSVAVLANRLVRLGSVTRSAVRSSPLRAIAAGALLMMLLGGFAVARWLVGGGGGGGSGLGGAGWKKERFFCGSEEHSTGEIKPFIFVYDLGGEFTSAVLKMAPSSWYSEAHDAERVLYEHLRASRARTWNPAQASLFYVPFFSAHFTALHSHDPRHDLQQAVTATSQKWQQLLTRVRTAYPYFNRSGGADHFSVLAGDHARCHALTFLPPTLYARMFFLHMNGDVMVRSTHTHPQRGMQVLAYNYGTNGSTDIPDIPCYRPDLDIVIPPTLEHSSTAQQQQQQQQGLPLPTKPALTAATAIPVVNRSIPVFLRLSSGQDGDQEQPVRHHNHAIQQEVVQLVRSRAEEGWEVGAKGAGWAMEEGMRRATFCLCPPGHSQWTMCLGKAVLAGCIPVTFFRDNDNPWQDVLDYSRFSMNVDPDDIPSLSDRLHALLRSPPLLLRLQHNVRAVQ
ncbi:unnamed protein product, partial [Closterium sp. Naga37s-1]